MDKKRQRELLKQWKKSQERTYLLSKEQAESLLDFINEQVEACDCDHTLRFTQQWLNENIPQEQHEAALEELASMGGYCDCEVMYNCYEDYDIG